MRARRPAAGACVALLVLTGWLNCARADDQVHEDIIANPAPGLFSVCHGHSCTLVSTVSLDDGQWGEIARLFAVPAGTPQVEREQIADAIALFETIVGRLTGTSNDKPGNEGDRDWQGQMDCIDEATNSTTYLKLLANAGFLKWHSVEKRATRAFIILFPHTTAVVRDLQSGDRWAVDSWFFANGERPVIISLAEWYRGWYPGDHTPPSALSSRP